MHDRGLTLIPDHLFSMFYTDKLIRLKQTEFASSKPLFLDYFAIAAICPIICLKLSFKVLLILWSMLIRVCVYDPK